MKIILIAVAFALFCVHTISMNTKEGIRQYGVATVASAATVWLFYQYAVVRYVAAGLSSLNKSMAVSTLFLLGVVLLFGPLARMFRLFDGLLKYRKELGVMTFFNALTHVYLSMFPLARRGPFGFYQSQPLSAYFGLAALGIMFVLFLFSFSKLERILTPATWWKLQQWGARVSFVTIVVHMTVLKYAGWSKWLADRSPSLPPMALLATIFAAFVLAVRLGELFGMQVGRRVTQLALLAFVGVTAWLFV